MSTEKAKYRVTDGSVFEYIKEAEAYVFIGRLDGEDLTDWVYDYEHRADHYECGGS